MIGVDLVQVRALRIGALRADVLRARMLRGFTLMEAIVAVGMIMLLAGALALFVNDLGTTRAHVMRGTDRTRSAEAIFGAIESALQTAVVDGGARGAGVAGTDTELRVLSSRTDAAGGDAEEIARAAFAPLVVTQVQQNGSGVSIGRGGVATILPAEIGAVQLRYFDGEAWGDSFDSLAAGRLPTMVEVSIWFGAVEGANDEAGAGESAESTSDSADGSAASSQEDPRASEHGGGWTRHRLISDVPVERPPADRMRRIAVPDALASDGAIAEEGKR